MGAMPPPSSGLGKRAKREKRREKEEREQERARASAAAKVGQEKEPKGGGGSGAGLKEKGAFAYGSCDKCGWHGPGRRSRDRARKDLAHHLEDKPKHADHLAVTER